MVDIPHTLKTAYNKRTGLTACVNSLLESNLVLCLKRLKNIPILDQKKPFGGLHHKA